MPRWQFNVNVNVNVTVLPPMRRGDESSSTSPVVAQPQEDALPTRLAILYRFEGQETRRLIRTWWDRPTLAPDELRALVVADGALGIGEPFQLRIWDEHFQAWFVPDEILLVRGLRSVPASGAVSSVSYAVDVLLERPALTPALTGQGVAYLHQLPGWPSALPIVTSPPLAHLAASASGVAASHMQQPPPFLVAREQQSHSQHTDSSSLNEQQAHYTRSLIGSEPGRDGRPFLGSSDGDTPLGFECPPSHALPKGLRPAVPAETPLANGGFPAGAGGNGRSCSGVGAVPPLLAEPEFSSGRDFSTYPTPPLVHMSSSLSHVHGYGGAQEPLQLALLHAAPLVWRHEGRLAPLDHQSLSLDFKAEVRAMWDMLGRTKKQVSVRFDVASSAFLGEALAMRPAALHLVCHADYDPHKRRSGASEEDSFFVGLEDAEGALDPLSLHRLRALLVPALVRSTRLVFVSACHSQPAAEAFVDAGVPHVIAVRTRLKVLDDAAALFAPSCASVPISALSTALSTRTRSVAASRDRCRERASRYRVREWRTLTSPHSLATRASNSSTYSAPSSSFAFVASALPSQPPRDASRRTSFSLSPRPRAISRTIWAKLEASIDCVAFWWARDGVVSLSGA